jgi:hypothetical protein
MYFVCVIFAYVITQQSNFFRAFINCLQCGLHSYYQTNSVYYCCVHGFIQCKYVSLAPTQGRAAVAQSVQCLTTGWTIPDRGRGFLL